MEGSVWSQLFVQVVNLVSSLLNSLIAVKKQESPISSSNAPASAASSLSTSNLSQTDGVGVLRITRNPRISTTDAHFGAMAYDGKYIGVTMERSAVAIPEGTYRGYKRDSAHFAMRVVGIDVPSRTNIECHPANWPSQLLGCIAVGESKDGDALDNSIMAFDGMMVAVPDNFSVIVDSDKIQTP